MVSKKLFPAVLATVMILSIVGSTATFAQNQTSSATAKPTQSITQIIANDTNFTTLARLLNKTNLTGAKFPPGNYTLFAPTNDAFSKVDASTLARWQNNTTALKEVLWYHFIPKKLLSSNFSGSGTLTTVNGYTVPYSVDGTKIKVDNATITKADINATNGVIHVIDSVMIPPTATASATAAGGFLGLPGFEALYVVAGLVVVAYLVTRRRK
jgi:PGF-CTERM protein